MPDWKVPGASLVLSIAEADRHPEKWHDVRATGYTGTAAATLLGVNRYETPLDLYHRLTGQTPTDQHKDAGVLRFGTEAEPVLAAHLTDQRDVATRRAGTYRSKTDPRLLANVDRLTSDGGIAEFKTAGMRTEAAQQWQRGEIPGHAFVQAQAYLLVTGRSHAWFTVGIRNDRIDYDTLPGQAYRSDWFWDLALLDMFTFGPVLPDPDVQARIITAVDQMDAAVQARDESLIPWVGEFDPDKRWPTTVEGTTRIAEFGTADLADRRLELAAAQKRIKAEIDAIDDGMKRQLAGHETLLDEDGRVLATYKTVTSTRLDQKRLKNDHPQLAGEYAVEQTTRRFTVPTRKN